MHHQNIILGHASAFTLQEPCMVVDGGRSEEEWDGTGRRGSGGEIREDSSRSSDPRIGFSPRPERALGWWEPATLHPAHVRPREEPIAKLGHGQEAGVGAEPLDGGKARIAAKEVEVQTGPGFHRGRERFHSYKTSAQLLETSMLPPKIKKALLPTCRHCCSTFPSIYCSVSPPRAAGADAVQSLGLRESGIDQRRNRRTPTLLTRHPLLATSPTTQPGGPGQL